MYKNSSDCSLAHYCCLNNQLPKLTIVDDIVKKLTSNYVSEWKIRIETERGANLNVDERKWLFVIKFCLNAIYIRMLDLSLLKKRRL